MKISVSVRERGQGLHLPALVWNSLLALAAGLSTSLFTSLKGDSTLLLLSLTVAALVLLQAAQWLWLERPLRPLRELLSGAVEPTRARVVEAVRTTWSHPLRAAGYSVALWPLMLALVLGSHGLLTGRFDPSLLRVLPVGLTFCALSGLLVGLHTQLAVQRLFALLGAELPVAEVLKAAPADFRSVRLATVLTSLATIAVPVVVVVVMSLGLQDELLTAAVDALGTRRTVSVAALGWPLLTFALTVMALAVSVAWGLADAISEPLEGVRGLSSRVARGELTRATAAPSLAEVWRVSGVFAGLVENLGNVMRQVHLAEGRLSGSVGTLTESARRFQTGSERQASGLNQTSATTEELAHSARQIAANATSVLEIAQKTLGAAEAGQKSAEAFRSAVARMQQDNASIAGAVERLRGRVQQIGKIIEFINGVAERSDLLALSAELEGTRAGEVGRGFSLVATEMRRLAENVLESTSEVEELIGEIREATRQTGWATEKAATLASSSTGQADGVLRSLSSVADLALRTSNAVRTISLATQQQQTGTDQLAEAMTDILGVTQQSLGATRQLGSANERMQVLAVNLRTLVARFKVLE